MNNLLFPPLDNPVSGQFLNSLAPMAYLGAIPNAKSQKVTIFGISIASGNQGATTMTVVKSMGSTASTANTISTKEGGSKCK